MCPLFGNVYLKSCECLRFWAFPLDSINEVHSYQQKVRCYQYFLINTMFVLLCSTNKRLSPRSRYTFGLNEVVLTTNFFPIYGAFAFNLLFHEVKALYWKLSENFSYLKTSRTHFKCLFANIRWCDNRLTKHFLLPSTNLQLQDTLCVLRRKLDIQTGNVWRQTECH